jgi:hypothetical protein
MAEDEKMRKKQLSFRAAWTIAWIVVAGWGILLYLLLWHPSVLGIHG